MHKAYSKHVSKSIGISVQPSNTWCFYSSPNVSSFAEAAVAQWLGYRTTAVNHILFVQELTVKNY
ncbi:UNVERIFIED_CONTAM: hypothetical protein NCL1_31808 [Trichonephila clavipes]